MQNKIETMKTATFKSENGYENFLTMYRIETYDNGYNVTYMVESVAKYNDPEFKDSRYTRTHKDYEKALKSWMNYLELFI